MTSVPYLHLLGLAMPEVIVVATALIVLAFDLLFLLHRSTRTRFAVAAGLASVGCATAVLRLIFALPQITLVGDIFLANPLTHLVQVTLLLFTIVTLLLSVDSNFTEHVGEFVLLVLFATAGMMFLVASQDILVIFVCA